MNFTPTERPKMWLADSQMFEFADVDWRLQRLDATAEAAASGHGGADFYVHTYFRDAVLHNMPPDIDVYQAIGTAAPAILAAESIEQGSKPFKVPDFRPNKNRPAGQMPKDIYLGI